MDECSLQVRRWYEADIEDRGVVSRALAPVLFRVARRLVDDGHPREARRIFREALRHARGETPTANARALLWVIILSLPAGTRERVGRISVACSRAIDNLLGIRQPMLP
jgi:hypothetical protein